MGLPYNPLNNFVDFVSGITYYRKFRCFHNSRSFLWVFPETLGIHFVDFVTGVANYRKFRSLQIIS